LALFQSVHKPTIRNAGKPAIKKCWKSSIKSLTDDLSAVFLAFVKYKSILQLVGLGAVASVVSCTTPMPSSPVAAGVRAESQPLSVKQEVGSLEKRSRPGLGTGWGDTVDSAITYTKFERGGSKPKSLDIIYYNDKEGIEAMAQSWSYNGAGMQKEDNGLVEWGVKSGWGYAKNLHAGGKRFIIGKDRAQYSLVVRNVCHSRLEIVLSVDGLDVMNGKSASIKKRGYIIEPGKTLSVKGFRTSEAAVAAFKFSSVGKSYSNLRHGTTRNVGVIGMAVFTENGIDPWRWSGGELKARKAAQAFAEAPMLKAQ
jgi:hypothetical protein